MPINKRYLAKFEPGNYYHVLNRTNNKEPLFLDDQDRMAFLSTLHHYLHPFIEVNAYCLLGNHFHLLVKIKSINEIIRYMAPRRNELSKTHALFIETKQRDPLFHDSIEIQFRKLFISYTLSFNKQYFRSGNLFNRSFKRVLINDVEQLKYLCYYIHHNPVKHNVHSDFETYQWSSYKSYKMLLDNDVDTNSILSTFGGQKSFINYHQEQLVHQYGNQASLELI